VTGSFFISASRSRLSSFALSDSSCSTRAKRRLIIAFGDGVDDIADLLVDVGESCFEVANFGVDVLRHVADGLVHLLDEVRNDFVVELHLLQLADDVALDIFAPNLFVRTALLAVALVAAALHNLINDFFIL
jgi:hypothetical protein